MPPPDDAPPVAPDVSADDRPPLPVDDAPASEPPPVPAEALPAAPASSESASAVASAAHDVAPPPVDLTPRPFTFTGSGSEYFRLWIVNVALSVATLGIYSAWAKVRRLRYFYGHTAIDGATFGYHASPIAILKGRLVAYSLLLAFYALSEFAPLLTSVLYFPLAMVAPIVVVRALRFRAANSSYRGIRFGFDGMESDAYRVFLFIPMLLPVTLGLVYPFMVKRQREFYVGESRWGRVPFRLEIPTGRVYGLYAMAFVVLLLAFWPIAMMMSGLPRGGSDTSMAPALSIGFVYLAFVAVAVGVRTGFENLVWNHTRLDEHRFASRLRTSRMLWLYASNIVAIVATLGLFIPWARVRLAHYRARSLTLVPEGPLVTEAALGGAEDVASAAELSDAIDLDFGL